MVPKIQNPVSPLKLSHTPDWEPLPYSNSNLKNACFKQLQIFKARMVLNIHVGPGIVAFAVGDEVGCRDELRHFDVHLVDPRILNSGSYFL